MAPFIIFDLDGTLIESYASICQSLNIARQALGQPQCSQQFFAQHRGGDLKKLFASSCPPGISESEFKILFDKHYCRHCLWQVQPLPVAQAILQQACQKGVKAVVLTNKNQVAAETICQSLFAPGSFAHIIGRRGPQAIKPFPQGVQRLHECSLNLKDCLAYYGDSQTDAEMAKMLKVPFINVALGN